MVSPARAAELRWEDTFRQWGAAPAPTEQERCDNAVRVVDGILRRYGPLSNRNFEVYAKGSYANRTNVRHDSDVDVSVRYRGAFYSALAPGVSERDLALSEHAYSYADLRREVEAALRLELGADAQPGTIAIKLRENTYRVRADVVACFEHRWYFRMASGEIAFHRGEWLYPPTRGAMVNWPEQNYTNGTDKNTRTGRRFKMLVRCLKALRNQMADEGVTEASPICSFLIECLAYNVPDEHFRDELLAQTMRRSLRFLWACTHDGRAADWYEVNELKQLFTSEQTWRIDEAERCLASAAEYVGLL